MSYERLDRWLCDFCGSVEEIALSRGDQYNPSPVWPPGGHWRQVTISGNVDSAGSSRHACARCARRLEIVLADEVGQS